MAHKKRRAPKKRCFPTKGAAKAAAKSRRASGKRAHISKKKSGWCMIPRKRKSSKSKR